MNERNILKLKKNIEKQKEICRNNIATFGKDHEITRLHLRVLGNLICLLAKAEGRCKV
jgi:hypothetical protein